MARERVERAKQLPNALHMIARSAATRAGHDEIAFRAWELWRLEGCPANSALDHWLRAEQELSQSLGL